MRLLGLHLPIAVPFLIALVVPFLFRIFRQIHTGWFVILVPLALFGHFLRFLPVDNAEPVQGSLAWIKALDIHFAARLDGLALLFALIITGMGILVVLYSIYYMDKETEALGNFYAYMMLFMGSMLGVVLSDNLIVLYTFWEITSVSSFLLIGYWHQRRKARYGAQKSMMITVFGGFAMLLGFIGLHAISGTFSISAMTATAGEMAGHPFFIPAMLLILLGAFTKSAQLPFHIWLPDAMEAPTPISAYLHSATMVKAGVFLVARLTPVFGARPEWAWIVMLVGLATLFWGSFSAVRQHDLKAMLAYSTVSQLGLIMAVLGAGAMALGPSAGAEGALMAVGAILAALFHLVNHSVFKGSLFMVVGILDHETGSRDLRRLSGLMGVMPVSFTIALVGALSMAGLPPLGGFLSKEMFFTGILDAARSTGWIWAALLPLAAWVASVFTFVYCMVLILRPFTGPYRPEVHDKRPREAPLGMLLAPAVLAVLAVGFFFFPNALVAGLVGPAVGAVLPGLVPAGEPFPVQIQAWHGLNTELFMTLGVIALGAVLYSQLPRWSAVYDWLPARISLNNFYDGSQVWGERLGRRVTRTYMTGYLAHYLSYIFLAVIGLVGGSLLLLNAFSLDASSNSPISIYELMLGLAVVAAAVAIIFSRSRLTSIISLSAVGLTVSLFYVVFRAPDLALTQLVVETISTGLFLLCFYFLPRMPKALPSVPVHAINALIAVGVGTTLTLIGLSAQGYQVFEPIASYFERSDELAGALNMVNALLVDFRGFDTMLESVVLFAAGIGVYALIKLRQAKAEGEGS